MFDLYTGLLFSVVHIIVLSGENSDLYIGIFVSKYVDFQFGLCYSLVAEVNTMPNITSAIRDTIPISLFNRGFAGKIFDEVKQVGAKVVMKNNTAECVLMSPDEYIRLMDELNDARLLAIAAERMAHFDPATAIPGEEVYSSLGITREDIDACGEVEFE